MNSPEGITTSFMPTEFTITVPGGSSSETDDSDLASTGVDRLLTGQKIRSRRLRPGFHASASRARAPGQRGHVRTELTHPERER